MKKLLVVLALSVLLFSSCKKNSVGGRDNPGSLPSGSVGPLPARDSAAGPARKPGVGDHVLYMYDGYHFYEADLVSVDGTRAKLERDGQAVERDLADVYPIPKAGDEVRVKPGDFVAARYGRLPTWPTAEVLKVAGDKITVRRITSGSVEELAPENVLAVSQEAADKIRKAAKK